MAVAGTFEIQETWSNRVTPYGWNQPPVEVLEGSITGTFTADEPIELIAAGDGFQKLSPQSWQRVFTWDENDSVLAVFRGMNSGMIDSVWATPAPLPPLEPGTHSFPLLHLQVDQAGLWSAPTGLYVWGDQAPNWDERGEVWERSAQLNMWEAGGDPILERTIGLRINGGWSRCLPQKSLRLYFDHHADPGHIVHDFFGDGPTVSERLLLRQIMHSEYLLTDHWATAIFRQLGHLTSRWTPVITHLNGEYWGMYSLRERLDDEWATTTLGYDSDDIILVKDGITEHGDPMAWPDFLSWLGNWDDPSSHAFYVEISLRFDMVSYTDWILLNALGASPENGFRHNLVILRGPDQRWRYVMWDEDDIFPWENLQANLLRLYAAADHADFLANLPPLQRYESYTYAKPYCDLFRQLMGNAQYRTLLAHRADLLLQGPLAVPTAQARLDSILTLFQPGLPLHAPRFEVSNLEDVESHLADYQEFFAQRHPIFTTQFIEFRSEFLAPVELSGFSANLSMGEVALAWRTERERDNLGFEIWRAVTDSTALELLADYSDFPQLVGSLNCDEPRQYAFIDAEVPVQSTIWYQLRHVDINDGTTVHDWLQRVGPAPLSSLVINEFMAKNDSTFSDPAGEFDDWVELYNQGADYVNLEGYYLTDNLGDPTKWPLPAELLRPGGFLMIWCDSDPEQGDNHATFKLAASGEQVGLYSLVAGLATPIDTLSFGPQIPDISQGRLPDGFGSWQTLIHPTPGSANSHATGIQEISQLALTLHQIVPNPGDREVEIRFSAGRSALVSVDIYDPRGRRVRSLLNGEFQAGEQVLVWDRCDGQGRPVSAGVYLVRIQAAGSTATGKIGVVR